MSEPAAAPAAAPAPTGGEPAPAAAPAAAPAPTAITPVAAPAPAPGGEPSANIFATPPDGWRGSLLEAAGYEGEDLTKRAGQLERVVDLPTMTKNYFEAQDRIRKGEISNGLPENPTEQQVDTWRAANGVPPAATDYEMTLDEGLVLGDDDNRILEGVLASAHAGNVPTTVVNSMVNAMLAGRELEAESMSQQDGLQQQQATQSLKEAWGQDYETNKNMVGNLMNIIPEAVREDFQQARLPDGRAVFNSPEMVAFFADMARQINPAGAVVPNSNNPTQAITDEIATLEARMGGPDWHGDKAAQERLMSLYDAREKMSQ